MWLPLPWAFPFMFMLAWSRAFMLPCAFVLVLAFALALAVFAAPAFELAVLAVLAVFALPAVFVLPAEEHPAASSPSASAAGK